MKVIIKNVGVYTNDMNDDVEIIKAMLYTMLCKEVEQTKQSYIKAQTYIESQKSNVKEIQKKKERKTAISSS